MQITEIVVEGQSETLENRIDIGGYSAVWDPRLNPNANYPVSREESDAKSLKKLWYCGFDVADLRAAHDKFRISPLRTVSDIYTLLAYKEAPKHFGKDERKLYTEEHLTSLAFVFPNLHKRDEVYPHTRLVRIRYPVSLVITNYDKKTNTFSTQARKYGQPIKVANDQRSSSEPYFLLKRDLWDKVMDVNRTLYITESELKACSLGLAGFAAIGFSGINTWGSPKGKKHQLHASLDPNGPWGRNTIPVIGRKIVIMFDTDNTSNAQVAESAKHLAKALLTANALSVRIAKLPSVFNTMEGTGVDDFLHHHLGPRWAGSKDKIEQAGELIEEVVASAQVCHSLSRYKAYSVVRSGERLLAKLSTPESFAFYEVTSGEQEVRMRLYNGSEYLPCEVGHSAGSTSGKVIVNNVRLQQLARDSYEEGVNLEILENGDDPDIAEMPVDFPNKVFAEVNRGLPRMKDQTVIGVIPGVAPGDHLIRVKNAIINATKCFQCCADWSRRAEWLLPTDYRYISTGCLDVKLPNQDETPQCPLFMNMITHGFSGDQERIECLRRFMGKVFCNPIFHGLQKFLCLFGNAGGGKSTVVEIITHIVGAINMKCMRYNQLERFDTGDLPGKRLVVFPETGDDGPQDKFSPQVAALLKQITCGEMVTCERKGRDAITAFPKPEVILVSNPPPIIPMDRGALERRGLYLRWSGVIEKVDPGIPLKIIEHELPGILLWALGGASVLFEVGYESLKTPAYCMDDLSDSTMSSDPVSQFVLTQLRVNPKSEKALTFREILEHFQQWTIITKHANKTLSGQRLGHFIANHFHVRSVNQRINGTQTRVYPTLELSDPKLKKARDLYGSSAY